MTEAPLTVLGWGTYDRERHPRVGILLDGLAKAGVTVLEVNRPDRSSTATRVGLVRHPWRAVRHLWSMLGVWRRLLREARAVKRSLHVDALLVGYLGHLDVIVARLAFPRTRILLDHLIFAEDTARDRRAGGRVMRFFLRRLDRAAIRSANLVLLDTPHHLDLVPRRLRRRCVVIPVGAADAWFAAGAHRLRGAGTSRDPLTVIFFGLFTPLHGAPVIARALSLLSQRGVAVSVTLVGGGQDEPAARAALKGAKVTWLPWVEPTELPRLVGSHDVCLGVFGTSAKALRVVPNKVFQGMAAGCAVLTSDTPAQRSLLVDSVRYTAPGDAEALAASLADLAADRPEVRRLAAAGRALAGEKFTSEAIGRDLLRHLGGPTP